MFKENPKMFVICHNIAVDEVTAIHEFSTEKAARAWVDKDIEKSTTEPFTQSGHPMWDKDDINRLNPDCIRAADEFEWIITECGITRHNGRGSK